MPATLDEIRAANESRLKAIADVRAIDDAANGRDLTADETRQIETFNGEIADLDARIAKMLDDRATDDRSAELDRRMAAILDAAGTSSSTQSGQPGDIEGEVRSFLRGESRSVTIAPATRTAVDERRDLTVGTATAGGNTVATTFYEQLVEHKILQSGLLMAGPTTISTTSGEPITVPKTTAHPTAALVAEAGTVAGTDPTFGQVTLGAFKYGVLVQVSRELVDDTAVDLLGYLARRCGQAVGNAFGNDVIVGNGTNKPHGVQPLATTGATGATGKAGAPSFDDLITLYYSVIAPYRASSSAAWLLNDTTAGVIRTLKDTTGRYLWEPATTVGAPDAILGKPVFTDPFIPAVGLGVSSILFGDFSAYFVRQVSGIRFERSDEFAFGTDLVSFRCLYRGDGNLVDATGAIKAFKGGAS